MPLFTNTQLIAAGASANVLAGWNFRFPPKPSMLEIFINATATGCVMNLTTGPESIAGPDIPVSAGGTAGVLPNSFNQQAIIDVVNAGEECQLTVRNTTGGGITVNTVANMTYNQGK